MNWPKKETPNEHLSVGQDAFVRGYNRSNEDCTKATIKILEDLRMPIAQCMNLEDYNKAARLHNENLRNLIQQLKYSK